MVSSRSTDWRWVATLAILAGVSAPARAGFTIQDLGVIVPGGTSGADAINATGGAGGMVTSQGGTMFAARSAAGGDLEKVPVAVGSSMSIATAINNGDNGQGDLAGYYTDKNGTRQGFYTAQGHTVLMNNLSLGTQLAYSSQANGLNDSGTVVGTGQVGSNQSLAFTTTGGTPKVINPLVAGGSDQGNGINATGTVVGTSEIAVGGLQHAFTTDANGQAVDLIHPGGNTPGDFHLNTYGMAIANNGDIAGYGDVAGSEHAFYAASAGGPLVDLGTLANASSSRAMGINDNQLVVGASGSGAFLWGASAGLFDLNTLISTADRANWSLTQAGGINDSDQIAGEGYFDGVLHGFLLTPIAGESIFEVPGAIPTPPALLLSAMGLAIVAVGSRLRRGRSGARGAA